MKNIYDAPEFEVISLMADRAMCAGEEDKADGGQEPTTSLPFIVG